jgi:hypothetical protein
MRVSYDAHDRMFALRHRTDPQLINVALYPEEGEMGVLENSSRGSIHALGTVAPSHRPANRSRPGSPRGVLQVCRLVDGAERNVRREESEGEVKAKLLPAWLPHLPGTCANRQAPR